MKFLCLVTLHLLEIIQREGSKDFDWLCLFSIHHPFLPAPIVWHQNLDSSLGKCSSLLILVVQVSLLTSEF